MVPTRAPGKTPTSTATNTVPTVSRNTGSESSFTTPPTTRLIATAVGMSAKRRGEMRRVWFAGVGVGRMYLPRRKDSSDAGSREQQGRYPAARRVQSRIDTPATAGAGRRTGPPRGAAIHVGLPLHAAGRGAGAGGVQWPRHRAHPDRRGTRCLWNGGRHG